MALEDIGRDAQILTAQLAADLGAVDSPLAPVFDMLGLKIRPGMQMLDSVSGEIVEVVGGGIENVSGEAGGT
jgi:hypothetical protein